MAELTATPTPSLTALPDLDKLIKAQVALIAQQGKASRQSLLLSQKRFRAERKQNRVENNLLLRQIKALQIEPAPAVTSPRMQEVEFARRQTAIDAGSRMGMRKSILAGESAGKPAFSGSSGAPTAMRRPILG